MQAAGPPSHDGTNFQSSSAGCCIIGVLHRSRSCCAGETACSARPIRDLQQPSQWVSLGCSHHEMHVQHAPVLCAFARLYGALRIYAQQVPMCTVIQVDRQSWISSCMVIVVTWLALKP